MLKVWGFLRKIAFLSKFKNLSRNGAIVLLSELDGSSLLYRDFDIFTVSASGVADISLVWFC